MHQAVNRETLNVTLSYLCPVPISFIATWSSIILTISTNTPQLEPSFCLGERFGTFCHVRNIPSLVGPGLLAMKSLQ